VELPLPVGQLPGHPVAVCIELVFPPCRGEVEVAVCFSSKLRDFARAWLCFYAA
jgi:hypothetical protein